MESRPWLFKRGAVPPPLGPSRRDKQGPVIGLVSYADFETQPLGLYPMEPAGHPLDLLTSGENGQVLGVKLSNIFMDHIGIYLLNFFPCQWSLSTGVEAAHVCITHHPFKIHN